MNSLNLSIGVDFGGTSIKIAVVEGATILTENSTIDPHQFNSPKELINELNLSIQKLKKSHPEVKSIGCGVPGFVNPVTGVVLNLTNVPGWKNIPLARILTEKTQLPCFVDNDANTMGIAESVHGAGKPFENFICLTLGTGVGGSIFIRNQVYHGARFAAGEIGQTSIDYQGVKGEYNNPGALEKYVGNKEFAHLAQQFYHSNNGNQSLNDYTPKNLKRLADLGDSLALDCWNLYAQKLACSLANCCWILNPESIIIGGGLSNAGDTLFNPLRTHLFEQLSQPFKENIQIIPAHFGEKSGVIGCATMALQKL